MARPIDELELDTRVWNVFIKAGIRTVDELIRFSPRELLRLQNFGKTSLRLVEIELRKFGLELDNDLHNKIKPVETVDRLTRIEAALERLTINLQELTANVTTLVLAMQLRERRVQEDNTLREQVHAS